MGQLLEIVTPLHVATARDYLARMLDHKVHCMRVAKQFGPDYWDGDRRYGYGGYNYIPGHWKSVAEILIRHYGLTPESKVLDIGCGKAFLLYEMKLLVPELQVAGLDISSHGLVGSKQEISPYLFHHRAQDPLPFENGTFDLVISLATLHNLRLHELQTALSEMERVGRQNYLMLESYRNEQELFNLQCWALTCQSFFDPEQWVWIYREFGYTGDYEFIFFE